MKNKKIFNLILLLVVMLLLGVGVWKFSDRFKILLDEDKLIYCKEHIDDDGDMLCDLCHSAIPFSTYAENKSVEVAIGNNVSGEDDGNLKISGYMPKKSEVVANRLDSETAISTARKYKSDIDASDVVAGFDISISNGNLKYQPNEYNQKVEVTISNLNLDLKKTYALLHIINENDFEILPANKITANEISFSAGSFSTYIVITVGSQSLTFDGSNFKVFNLSGDEITDGTTVASGTAFAFNVVPNDGWGVTDIVCNLSSEDSAISSYGNIIGKNCYIASVSENLTVSVTTVIAPSVTTQPVSTKVMHNSLASFSVVAENATSYEWQYRKNENDFWKSAKDLGGNTSATFSFTALPSSSRYEFRCLVGNANFIGHERVKSDIVTVSVAQGMVKVGETPIIMVQPNMNNGKVKVNTGRGSYSVTAFGGTDLTFTWQYRENENDYWKEIDYLGSSSDGTYNATTHLQTSTFTTNTATYQMNGYQFRCLVGNSFYFGHDAIKSDIVVLSVAYDDIFNEAKILDVEITKHPESQKVKLGENATFSITAINANPTYRWEYMLSGESFWSDVTSSMSSTYNKATMTIGTSAMSVNENLELVNSLSGAKFRCVVTDDTVDDYTKTSDIAVLSVVQGVISEKAKVVVPVSNLDFSIPDELCIYNGTAYEPVVTLLDGGVDLDLGVDYTVTYSNNIDAGEAVITITGSGDYTGTRTENFTISPKNIGVSWQDLTLFEYNGSAQAPTASASGVNEEQINLKVNGAQINYGTSYTATASIESVVNGRGKTTNYTLSNAQREFSISKKSVTVIAGDKTKTYDGNALTWEDVDAPGYTITGIISGHVATVARSGSITNAGTATHKIESVTITSGSTDVTGNYDVTTKNGLLTVNVVGSVIFVVNFTGTSEFTYDGTAHEPAVSVTANGVTLTAGTDYTLKYADNVNATENAKVIVTGTGNYVGSNGSKTFKINKKAITITSKNMEKVYDGSLLKYSDIAEPRYTVTPADGIATRDTLSVVTTGQVLNVGEESHTISSYSIMAGDVDSKNNYNVTLVNGKLKIKAENISAEISIVGEIETGFELNANVLAVPDDCAKTYQWWYEDERGVKTNIAGATGATFKVKGENLIGKFIGVTVTLTRLNYNPISVSTKTTAIVTWGENKNVLMGREDDVYIIGAKRAKNQTNDNEFLSYTADLVKEIRFVITENAPAGSWDVSKNYGDEAVIAWITSDGILNIGCEETIVASNGINLFSNYTNCTSITGLENLDTSSVESMANMFEDCSSLASLEVEKLSTGAATSMKGMFKNCNNLTALNLSKLKTIRVTNMSEMFAGCSKLASLDVKDFRTINVKNMSEMFRGCSSLTSIDIGRFDTSNVENFANMFNGCSGLTCIRLENFTTTKANSVEGMFDGCSILNTLVLGKNFKKIDGANMFRNCSGLKRIIAKSETAMTFATNTGLNAITNAKIYVEKNANLSKYSSATNYSALYEADRVRAMLEIVGDNPANATYGETYTDAGATVAGWAESEKAEYEKLGYTLTTTGLPVNTNQVGKHHVIYTLKYSAQTVDTAIN